MMKPEPTKYLRIGKVAELLDISRPSVYDLIRNGTLTGVIKVGCRLRIPQSAVDDWLARGLRHQAGRRTSEQQ